MTSLNHVLARWLDDEPGPIVDCGGCARPTKCCDFQPFVPNFLVGAARADGGPWPVDPWQYRAQPLGLVPTRAFRAGRGTMDATCAFYRAGRCGIWSRRPGECSGFNCARENPGITARTFALETMLAQMALVEQGYGDDFVRSQIDILNDPGEELAHADDVEDTYARAWAWARDLSRADIAAWLEDL